MVSISLAYNFMVTECNKSNVGYSQDYRAQQTVNGITYYDCSSIIWYALLAGGFDCVSANGGSTYPFWTGSMEDVLLKLGFKKYVASVEWKNGDIVWKTGHTEMVYSGQRTMGAHTDGVALANQVSINTSDTSKTYYECLYRYEETVPTNWISKNAYLSQSEMENNAKLIYSYFKGKGWTLNAIAGMLGNMQQESTINPGIWQNLTPNTSMGWGLVQWTPSTNFTNWASANGYENDDGYAQLNWIEEQTVPTGQWIATSDYPMSFDEFKTSTKPPTYLASVFLKNFERAGTEKEELRKQNAVNWYNFLYNTPIAPTIRKKKTPIWLMI